jgi:hypothetical protein
MKMSKTNKESIDQPILSVKIYVNHGTHENAELITLEGLKKLLDSIENCEVKK